MKILLEVLCLLSNKLQGFYIPRLTRVEPFEGIYGPIAGTKLLEYIQWRAGGPQYQVTHCDTV